jgi:hypothetical protein
MRKEKRFVHDTRFSFPDTDSFSLRVFVPAWLNISSFPEVLRAPPDLFIFSRLPFHS